MPEKKIAPSGKLPVKIREGNLPEIKVNLPMPPVKPPRGSEASVIVKPTAPTSGQTPTEKGK